MLNQNKFFVTGIGTDVGKTIISAILVEALQADYWKPIQAGDLHYSDTDKVKELVSNTKSVFHKNSYALNSPESPHSSAKKDGINIELDSIIEPNISNSLIVEGAGGLLVPLNNKETILDFIKADYNVILVSRHYLGSINHTLLSIEVLKSKGINVFGIIFNGDEHVSTESIITEMTGVPVIGRVSHHETFSKELIKEYAVKFRKALHQ